MIAFRADANAAIGTGHIMRCLAIAKELQQQGEEIVFLTADEEPSEQLRNYDVPCRVLHTDWMRMEDEIEQLAPVLVDLNVNCMLADSYYVTAEYLKQVGNYVATAYLDDFGIEAVPADLLINHQIFADALAYQKLYAGYETRLLLGTQYVPLRQEFRGIKPRPVREHVENILITTGGTDPLGISYVLIERMMKESFFKNTTCYVITGRFSPREALLKRLWQQHPNVILCENVSCMSELMLQCDIAVSASGTTLYELCACGLPPVIFSFADNQLRIRERFGESGAMLDCGDFRDQKETCLEKIIRAVQSLECREKRMELRDRLLGITDGMGAARVARQLKELTYERNPKIQGTLQH